jgi:hypothetical protein
MTALIVSQSRELAARVAILLAPSPVKIKVALGLDLVEPLLEGSSAVFAVVPAASCEMARSLPLWGAGRAVFALVFDEETADSVRESCDAVIEPPWCVEAALGQLAL